MSTQTDPIADAPASKSIATWLAGRDRYLFAMFLCVYAIGGACSLRFFPSYGWPSGDEATYYSYALHPWRLTSDFFEGYPPKEAVNPYNFRLFLAPFSAIFYTVGFTVFGARLIILAYGVALLALCYALARRLASPLPALAVVITFAISPTMLYATHVARPEGMMALWLMGGVWLLVRSEPPCSRGTCFAVGLLAASALWIHYHGVTYPLLLGVAWLGYDRGAGRGSRALAMTAGWLVVGALYALLNLWPARATIAEYGWLPVTFASSSRVPLLEPARLLEALRTGITFYAGVLAGPDRLGRLNVWSTLPVLVAAGYGLWAIECRRGRALRWLLAALAAAYLLVFPNARWEYLLYAYPALIVLAAAGLARLPEGRDMQLLAAGMVGAAALGYAVQSTHLLLQAWEHHPQNLATGRAVRQTAEEFGPLDQVTVMGPQELHCFVVESRFRTFHSLITTRDLQATLERFEPQVVILSQRAIEAITIFLNDRLVTGGVLNLPPEVGRKWMRHRLLALDPVTETWSLDPNRVEPYVRGCLAEAGYVRRKFDPPLRWDGGVVAVYVRGATTPTTASGSSAADP